MLKVLFSYIVDTKVIFFIVLLFNKISSFDRFYLIFLLNQSNCNF